MREFKNRIEARVARLDIASERSAQYPAFGARSKSRRNISLIGVPENWTPDQIASYQKYWDAYFDGDLTRRRRAKFVPGGVAKTFIQTKEPDLKGPFDDWLARIVCFAFSISPQGLVQQMNRATAQTQKELSQEEGLAPVLAWVKGLIDDILADEFAAPDLEFIWSADPSLDPQTQETILSSYTTKGILTINEARAALGREPLPEAAANRAMALTGNGYVTLGDQAKPAGHVANDNPYHDERGRFTTADGVGAASDRSSANGRVRVAANDTTPVNFTSRPAPVDNQIQQAHISCEDLWESDMAICLSVLIVEDPHYHGLCVGGARKRFDECLGGLALSPLLPY